MMGVASGRCTAARLILAAVFVASGLPLLGTPTDDLLGEAEMGSVQDTQRSIQASADVNARVFVGGTVLMLAAAWNPDPEVVRVLVKAGAEVNAHGPHDWTAFMATDNSPNPAVVEALLAAGADPRLKILAGRTTHECGKENTAFRETETFNRLRRASQ